MILEKEKSPRYKILSHKISSHSHRCSIEIFDHLKCEVFDVPARLVVADEDFMQELSEIDFRLVKLLVENEIVTLLTKA
jgi:hypothetical protein